MKRTRLSESGSSDEEDKPPRPPLPSTRSSTSEVTEDIVVEHSVIREEFREGVPVIDQTDSSDSLERLKEVKTSVLESCSEGGSSGDDMDSFVSLDWDTCSSYRHDLTFNTSLYNAAPRYIFDRLLGSYHTH